jgi:hypothetical protein
MPSKAASASMLARSRAQVKVARLKTVVSPKLLALGMRNCAMTCGDVGSGRCRSGYKKPLVLQPYHPQPGCGVFVYIRRSIFRSFPSSKAICGRHADVTPG